MSRAKLFAVYATVLLAVPLVGSGAVAGAATGAGNVGNVALSVGTSQGAGYVTVAVSEESTGEPLGDVDVSITSNGAYAVSGVTDEHGIVSFDGPTETVVATVTAELDGSTATRTVTLRASKGRGPPFVPLGQTVSAYVDSLRDVDGPLGPLVSEFVRELNDDDRGGPPADRGPN